jgi:parvulin-like peptidyl-prolyl isomerase
MKPLLQSLVLPSLLVAVPVRAEIVEKIVAKVNGQIVTLSEFESRQVAAVQQARISMDQVPAYLQANNSKILQEAIDDEILVGRAAEIGAKVRPEYVKDIIDNIKKENKLESDEQLLEQLRREGMTLADLKRNIERSVLKRQVLGRELEAKTTVTDAEQLAEYESRKKSYGRPETVTLQEILVHSEEEAKALVDRARAGEDFAALAQEASAAPSAKGGGALGTLQRGELSADLERVAFALSKGAVSEPIPTAGGFRILRAADKTEASVVPYEQVKEEIAKQLAQQKWDKQYETYMEGLRKTAVIEVLVKEVPLSVSSSAASQPNLSAPPAAPDAEISTSPQDAPEQAAPPSPPPQ